MLELIRWLILVTFLVCKINLIVEEYIIWSIDSIDLVVQIVSIFYILSTILISSYLLLAFILNMILVILPLTIATESTCRSFTVMLLVHSRASINCISFRHSWASLTFITLTTKTRLAFRIEAFFALLLMMWRLKKWRWCLWIHVFLMVVFFLTDLLILISA
jgi:hypothetical protein